VTGSAHCVLASYFAARLSRHSLRAYQASKRGGVLALVVHDANARDRTPPEGRVWIDGHAVTVLRATMQFTS
jgi:predicted PhzF superfamily epimerase YddE/YHI9